MTKFLKTNYNQTIAYNKIDGNKLGIVFLSGLKSDMTGQKAIALEEWAINNNHSFLRFDYSGHGISSGKFNDFVISDYKCDGSKSFFSLTHDNECQEFELNMIGKHNVLNATAAIILCLQEGINIKVIQESLSNFM